MSFIRLFHMPGSCSRVTLNALEEIGLAFEDRAVNIFKGEQREPAFLRVNPKGKVPTLQVEDRYLTETPAILHYLAETYPAACLFPSGASTLERAAHWSDLIWLSNTVHPLVRTCLMPGRVSPQDPEGARQVAIMAVTGMLRDIDGRLARQDWWYGRAWSITDVYLYWCVSIAALGGIALENFPALEAHSKEVRARDSFQRALARETAAVSQGAIQLPSGAQL